MFGMVLQDTWLFHGTIMENLRYGRLDATDEEVIQAAKAAHVHRFVQTLPGGYNMELNEEASNVSQGQKQYTIARAILADPKLPHEDTILHKARCCSRKPWTSKGRTKDFIAQGSQIPDAVSNA